MNNKITRTLLVTPLLLNACATTSKSMLLGAAVGSVAGMAIGQGQSQNSSGTAVGGLIGGGLGTLVGYLASKEKEKHKLTSTPKASDNIDFTPSLTKPKVRSYTVPDSIEGNKYIKSHEVFILEDPGSWSKE